MKVTEAINKRYSCRNYSEKPVGKEEITELVELANQAPSAGNQQNREFIVITDEEDRKWLGKMNGQPHLHQAPVVILVVSEMPDQNPEEYLEGLKKWEMTVNGVPPDEVEITDHFRDELVSMNIKFMVSDAAAAVENLLLSATEKGLATCWIGIMDFEGVRKRFNVPGNYEPICLVTLGYEAQPPAKKSPRKPISALTHWGKF